MVWKAASVCGVHVRFLGQMFYGFGRRLFFSVDGPSVFPRHRGALALITMSVPLGGSPISKILRCLVQRNAPIEVQLERDRLRELVFDNKYNNLI